MTDTATTLEDTLSRFTGPELVALIDAPPAEKITTKRGKMALIEYYAAPFQKADSWPQGALDLVRAAAEKITGEKDAQRREAILAELDALDGEEDFPIAMPGASLIVFEEAAADALVADLVSDLEPEGVAAEPDGTFLQELPAADDLEASLGMPEAEASAEWQQELHGADDWPLEAPLGGLTSATTPGLQAMTSHGLGEAVAGALAMALTNAKAAFTSRAATTKAAESSRAPRAPQGPKPIEKLDDVSRKLADLLLREGGATSEDLCLAVGWVRKGMLDTSRRIASTVGMQVEVFSAESNGKTRTHYRLVPKVVDPDPQESE